jgi:hypothetical protein
LAVDVDSLDGVWTAADEDWLGKTHEPRFTGALWQRRTVPGDPFAVVPASARKPINEPWRRGLVPIDLRKAYSGPWEFQEGPPSESAQTYYFSKDGLLYGNPEPLTPCDSPNWSDTYYRPVGKTWEEIEKRAGLFKVGGE